MRVAGATSAFELTPNVAGQAVSHRWSPRMHDQDARVILRTWFLDIIQSQACTKLTIQKSGQRHVSHTNTSAEPIAQARSIVCALCVAIPRKQLHRLPDRAPRSRHVSLAGGCGGAFR